MAWIIAERIRIREDFMTRNVPPLTELLKDAPKNWGRWGNDDEVGALNYLTPAVVLAAVQCIRQGRVFTLQVPMCDPNGDPVAPERQPAQHFMVRDKGNYLAEKAASYPGGLEYSDDFIVTFLQGTTHYDALGHVWTGEYIWNGFNARTTIGGLSRASILPIAEKGIVGRGVLLDIARHKGKSALDPGEPIFLKDLLECAARQHVDLRLHDILLIRTGWLPWIMASSPRGRSGLEGPGLSYSPDLLEWFHEMEIVSLVTDTLANEVASDPNSGVAMPLHVALMSYQGVAFAEMAWFEELAADCATDGQFDFFFVAAPIKVVGGTGSPVNPVAVK
jgi:kynurenine formamidase